MVSVKPGHCQQLSLNGHACALAASDQPA